MSSESQISNIDISEGEQIHRKQSSEGLGQIKKLPRDQSLGIEGRQVNFRTYVYIRSFWKLWQAIYQMWYQTMW